MKHKKFALATIMTLIIALVSSIAIGCKTEEYDNELSPLVIATLELDGVFSPFYATTGADSSVAGMTQIGMLSYDKDGNLNYGDEIDTVARYINEDKKDTRSDQEKMDETKNYPSYTTTYEIVIKNGIKFSDGTPLTYKDVFFNLYMFLDPVYNGSATLYSTNIVGLPQYRTQSEGDESAFEERITQDAIDRRTDFLAYYHKDGPKLTAINTDDLTELENDYRELRRQFKEEELVSDWSMFAGSMENYIKEYTSVKNKELVTEVWQAYLINWGLVTLENDLNGPDPTKYLSVDYGAYGDKVKDIKAKYSKKEQAKAEQEIRQYCIDTVFSAFFGAEPGSGEGDTLKDKTFPQRSERFITTTATGLNYVNYAAAQIKSKELQGDIKYPNVEGIKLKKYKAGDKFTDTEKFDREITLDEDHDVLSVTIYGVDPKAISNLGFSVTPMHYYSNPDAQGNPTDPNKLDTQGNPTVFTNATHGYQAFSIGVEGVQDHFGFPYASAAYMDKVVKAVSGLPMGAGTYKATNANGATDIKDVSALGSGVGFYDVNVVYYMRNEYFHTTAKSDKIQNAKIRLLRFAVTNTTRLFDAVKTKTVHYADPSAKVEIVQELENPRKKKDLRYIRTRTNGYGYIGVSAKFIPDLKIRRAIMYAMDISRVLGYYPEKFAENIYVPISKESWAYPASAVAPRYSSFDSTGRFDNKKAKDMINDLRVQAGYTTLVTQGNYYTNTALGRKLDYTFTIAGGNSDHPAFLTMQAAAQLLGECGFRIKVVTDPFALRKLSTGMLTVWAAAWSSGIDPDMYQVYHKDSQATSVNAWGYPSMLGTRGEVQSTSPDNYIEVDIIDRLSDTIDEARRITSREDFTVKINGVDEERDGRKTLYEKALGLVMDLAVELPTYQRSDIYVYRSGIIDETTLLSQDECSAYMGPMARIWEVSFVNGDRSQKA